jgi:ATP-dependent exoDNAse (exonuclease V) beta subunit
VGLKDIPDAYVKQLEGYATALRSIYPHHQIRKVLLWTAGPKVQALE